VIGREQFVENPKKMQEDQRPATSEADENERLIS